MALIIACPSIAAAQDSTSQPTERAGQAARPTRSSSEQAGNQIIVTGSRIAKLGFTSPTRVTVIEQQ
ncbi:hypothetical protein M2337_000279 [Sphingobium sp. B2D3A]|nr:hypothetical protein [Sphingobium sp. B2D3A]